MENRFCRITLSGIRDLLVKHGLLCGITIGGKPRETFPKEIAARVFSKLSFDSRDAGADTLFFVKGLNFRAEYLAAAIGAGLGVYIAEQNFPAQKTGGNIIAITVTDVKKAMALAAMEFYGNPQKKLFLVAFTGTKGKTTAVYFAKNILDRGAHKKTAMLSTLMSTLDGTTCFKSALTTPESLDLYRMMFEAVQNGAAYFVLEVSSQAYKTGRVFGLSFDVGVFLNISPDHIGPVEHPDFEDYFSCKRQLLHNSKKIVLNRDSAYFDALFEEAGAGGSVFVFGTTKDKTNLYFEADDNKDGFHFILHSGEAAGFPEMEGAYSIPLEGDFNKENALAAALACRLAGAESKGIAAGLSTAHIPGRMEKLMQKNGAAVYVDYAHNGVSLEALLATIRSGRGGRLIAVIGATGNKGQSRRKDIALVLSAMADTAILTADDPAFEDPRVIAEEIRAAMTKKTETYIIVDREEAIRFALSQTRNKNDAVAIAGKGADMFQIVGDKKIPYEGDYPLAEKIIKEE